MRSEIIWMPLLGIRINERDTTMLITIPLRRTYLVLSTCNRFLAAFAVLCSALFAAGCSSPRVEWVGSPVVGRNEDDGRYHTQPTIISLEIGLREDGVVVWREK